MEATQEAVDQDQFLTYDLTGEEYAINILQVREVIEYETLTPSARNAPLHPGGD